MSLSDKDVDDASSNASSDDENRADKYVLVHTGKYTGQFARITFDRDIYASARIVSPCGRLSQEKKTTLPRDTLHLLDYDPSKPLDLDDSLKQSHMTELIALREAYLNRRNTAPTPASTTKNSPSALNSEYLAVSRSYRKRKEPTRFTLDFKAAGKFNNESSSQCRKRLRNIDFVSHELEPFSEESSARLTAAIEAYSEEDRAGFASMVQETLLLRETNSTVVKLSLHGPVYYNRNEYYALPDAYLDEGEEDMPLLSDSFLVAGAAVDSTLEKVYVRELDGAGERERGRIGYLQGRLNRRDDGYSVLFVAENRREISRERVHPSRMDLLVANADDQQDLDLIRDRMVRLREQQQGPPNHSPQRRAQHQQGQQQSSDSDSGSAGGRSDHSEESEPETDSVDRRAGSSEDAIVCEICLNGDSAADNEIVFCDSCEVPVHQLCYSVSKVPRGAWHCYPCSEGVDPHTLPCDLCPHTGGAYMLSAGADGRTGWAHPTCVFCVSEVYEQRSPSRGGMPQLVLKNIDPRRFKLKCVVCNQRNGLCVQCSWGRCQTAVHPWCVLRKKKNGFAKKYIQCEGGKTLWGEVHCPSHATAGLTSSHAVPEKFLSSSAVPDAGALN